MIGWKSFVGVNKWQHYPETGLATSKYQLFGGIIPVAAGRAYPKSE
jgi:hypothetical protein